METFKKAIPAGIMIGIGATVFLSCDNRYVGAILFSIGLYMICYFDFNLFTGKIGYVIETKNNPNCLLIWLGNLVGCALCVLPLRFAKPQLAETALTMVSGKLDMPLLSAAITAMFCGVLMFVAVHNYKTNSGEVGKQIGIVLGVSVFILCGFEHSVADMCYCLYAVNSVAMALRALLFLIVVSLGNSVGAVLFRLLTKPKTEM